MAGLYKLFNIKGTKLRYMQLFGVLPKHCAEHELEPNDSDQHVMGREPCLGKITEEIHIRSIMEGIQRCLDDQQTQGVIVDFSKIGTTLSSLINDLYSLTVKAQNDRKSLVIVGPGAQFLCDTDITGLYGKLTMYASLREAVRHTQ